MSSKIITISSLSNVVICELPEGAETVHVAYNNGFWYLIYFTHNGEILTRKRLPKGNWHIVGMLSEVTESDASGLVESDTQYGTVMYRNYKTTSMTYYDEQITAIESLESAILAEGFTFQNNLRNPDEVCYFSRDRMIDDVRDYHEAQSRVLDRGRCLLMGREDL